jgi:NAD(P)-dependent dehydrogenase (short-subunit alcohol dehydrogenase family)
VALVTGSSRNIGKAIAERFAQEGAGVVINASKSEDELQETAEEFRSKGYRVLPVMADVSDPDAVTDMVRQSTELFGRIDILMMSHSVRPLRRFLEVTVAEWHAVMGINLDSAMYLCQAVLPGMVDRRQGSVITVGGDYLTGGGSHNTRPHVFSALAGRTTLMRALISEFGQFNIRFNFVSPGVINTVRKHPEWYPISAGNPQEDAALISTIPMGRVGQPVEVADAVLWLASEEASYVNGSTISVNGGWRL